jgi:replicative DNA helicase
MSQNLALGQGGRVAFFSLEMSAEQLAARLVSAEAEVEFSRLPFGRHSETEEGRISRAIGRLSRAEIYIDDTPGMTVAELRAKARRLDHDVGLDLVVVDHIQLLHASAGGGDGNRVTEMSFMSRSLKELAREQEIPVVALSQLSRAVEQRHPHVPMLSDLRDSGSLEQDADVVLFIYREDMYVAPDEWDDLHPEEPENYPNGDAQIIVAKHRNGPTGTVHLRFVKKLAKFEDFFTREEPVDGDLALAQQAGLAPASAGGSGGGSGSGGVGPDGPGDAQWALEAYDDD